LNVFEYSRPTEYLGAVLQDKQRVHPSFSLRAWSRQLGFKTPSMLSAVLLGQRKLKPGLATRIALALELAPLEQRYLEVMALAENSRSEHEQKIYLDILHSLRPREVQSLDLDRFRYIADWYHFAILEMVSLADFQADPDYISRRLGNTISPGLAASGLSRLLRMGLLVRNRKGRIVRSKKHLKAGDGVPSPAVRSHHLQILKKAEQALQHQALEERDFRGTTLPLKKKDLPQLKKLITEFHRNVQELSSPDGDEVYRVSSQAFRLTHSLGVLGLFFLMMMIAGCSPAVPSAIESPGTSSEVGNGGNFPPVLFLAGKTHAVQLIARVDSTHLPKRNFAEWLDVEHREKLTTALNGQKHLWAKDLPPECPRDHKCACHIRGNRIHLSYDGCVAVTDVKAAAATLIHEATHQVLNLVEEEENANEVAALYMNSWLTLGHPDALHWHRHSARVHESLWENHKGGYGPFHTYWINNRLAHFGSDAVALYDPVTQQVESAPYREQAETWRWNDGKDFLLEKGVVAGEAVIFLGACSRSGKSFSFSNYRWETLILPPGLHPRKGALLKADGKRLVLWGGDRCDTGEAVTEGWVYELPLKTWKRIPPLPVHPTRQGAVVDLVEGKLVIWSGVKKDELLSHGAVFGFDEHAWKKMGSVGAPPPRSFAESLPTDLGLFIYGGFKVATDQTASASALRALWMYKSGAFYDIKTDQWKAADAPNGANHFVREPGHQLVWNGLQVVFLDEYGVSFYNPSLNTWAHSEGLVHPFSNGRFDAFWTGFEILAVHKLSAYSLHP